MHSLNLLLALALIGVFSIESAKATTPYLLQVAEYNYSPLLDSNPHGRLNLIVPIKKLICDGVSDYDWYFYEVRTQTVPGRIAYGSNWRTSHTWAKHTVWSAGTNRWLVDYNPTTTSGQTTVGVSLSAAAGPQGPSAGYSISWSYTISDVQVLDESDFSVHRAYWRHEIAEDKNVGMYTYMSEPGFVVKTKQNLWSFVDGWYKVSWGQPVWLWWEYKDFESSILYLDAQMSGDVPTKITIQSYPTTDSYLRSHGMAIDQDLPENWWQYSGYEFMVTSKAFTYEKWVYLTYGSHYVEYAASGYVPNYAWHAKIYINDILKAEGDVGRYNANHLRAHFSV